jgi:hypothetical protein
MIDKLLYLSLVIVALVHVSITAFMLWGLSYVIG